MPFMNQHENKMADFDNQDAENSLRLLADTAIELETDLVRYNRREDIESTNEWCDSPCPLFDTCKFSMDARNNSASGSWAAKYTWCALRGGLWLLNIIQEELQHLISDIYSTHKAFQRAKKTICRKVTRAAVWKIFPPVAVLYDRAARSASIEPRTWPVEPILKYSSI